MRTRRLVVGVAALTFVTLLSGLPAAHAESSPYCGITWGSLSKTRLQYGAPWTNLRFGQHECWDRMVIDIGGMPAPGFDVRYVDAFRNQDTGEVVPVAGGAVLQVRAFSANYDFNGQPRVAWYFGSHVQYPWELDQAGFRTFEDVVYGGMYEGETTFVIGTRARLPFRVFTLDGPDGGSRLVVDVAHRW